MRFDGLLLHRSSRARRIPGFACLLSNLSRGVTKRNLRLVVSMPRRVAAPFSSRGSMPVIRFVREGRDVECFPGENLRAVAVREGIQLYGLKGQLGNCGGCGQCSTCFVKVEGETSTAAMSARTAVEEVKLRRRPEGWRCLLYTSPSPRD